MALIRYPEGQQRSGSSGGIVFSHNRFGAYVRPRTVPVNPNSTAQQGVRNSFGGLAIAWQGLTQTQRDEWDAYAAVIAWTNKFGDTVFLTGFNWYVQVNSLRLAAGLTQTDDAPVTLSMGPSPTGVVITGDESADEISVAFINTQDWADTAGGALYLQQGIAQPPSRTFFASPYRTLGVIVGAGTPPTSPQTFTPVFPISTGNRTYVRYRALYADGRVSPPLQTSFLTVA